VILSRALGYTKAEAEQFVKRMQGAGMIPADMTVRFATVPGGKVEGKRFAHNGSTAGARYLVRDARREENN
jgi:hypothetical protein